jgi:hypothetical protein
MSDLQKAIETCDDLLAVLNSTGSAYLYKHNGGKEKLESIIAELSRLSKLEAAMEKINNIRNSIIGTQTINWSEHIYPLVAALSEAGLQGLPYPEARKNFGTLIDRNRKLEAAANAVIKLNEDIKNIVGFAETEGVADDKGAKIRDAIDALAEARKR